MKKFLEKAADFILNNCRENSLRTAIIFPNKRTEVFLKNHLKQKVNIDFWLPEFYTIDEFMVRASGIQKQDPVLTYFELYKIHKEIEGANARSIDDFLVWAPVILSDFNDIDLYLADAEAVFTNLSETKAMEAWNPDGRPLTEMQQNYLAFFRSLLAYYSKLGDSLQEKNVGYTGRIYRRLAENMDVFSKNWPWERFIVIGLNALSKSEKQVFSYLKKHFHLDFFWDVDEYYLQVGKFGLKQMEAGRFIRELIAEWQIKNVNWIGDQLVTAEKNIHIVGVPKRIGQVKYAGQLLEELLEENVGTELDTAVVLADEKLLVPMLNALPGGEDNKKPVFNITMGYPFASGPLNSFTMQWLNLLIGKLEGQNSNISILHLNVLLNSPVVKLVAGTSSKAAELLSALNERNSPYLSAVEINKMLLQDDNDKVVKLIQLFLHPCIDAHEFVEQYIEFLRIAKAVFHEGENAQLLLKEQFNAMVSLIKNMRMLIAESPETINLKAFQKILLQIIRRSEINLKGEPLSGIQIMGMLETRNLDFKNIILLSANEGIIPKSTVPESFIPFDIRSQFTLPLPKEKIDVFAYHFYRLLQYAQNITLIYNSEADELGGGEKSRFILQLRDELAEINKKIHLTEDILNIELTTAETDTDIVIEKSPEILEAIAGSASRGFSPSALNSYIQCPLQYYFSRILALKPPKSIDDTIESNTFGTIIHQVLEQIYLPFLGKLIDADTLKKSLQDLDNLLTASFSHNLNNADFSTGKNLLLFEVAKKYVQQFVEADVRRLKFKPHHLLALEKELKTTLHFDGKEVYLRGTIDRIDENNEEGTILLADYKTGKVEKKDLKFDDWEVLSTEPKYDKAFQLLFYTYLYQKNNLSKANIEPGIFSFRNISGGFITMTLAEEIESEALTSEFEKVLIEIIGEIFDPETPFAQTENKEACKWCVYSGICNREGSSAF